MEFYATAEITLTQAELQSRLTVAQLGEFCASIDRVLEAAGDEGEIYCLWGQFRVRREAIRAGVRFTLPDCPNALAWTVTAGTTEPEPVVIHCTINRRDHDFDFIDSIHQFIEDWRAGIERTVW